MSLRSFALRNFRNHSGLELKFQPRITVITGHNGIGKTSILEAIAILGSGKSFRIAKNRDLVRSGQERALIAAQVEHQGLTSDIRIEIHGSGKRLQLNGKAIRQLRNLHAVLPYVVFSPQDHRIIDGDASDRRHFLNQALSAYDHDYADILADFNRALVQRNQLLKALREQPNGFSRLKTEVEVWDAALSETGAQLVVRRQNYLDQLGQEATQQYTRIAQKPQNFRLQYLPLGQGENESEKNPIFIAKKLRERWQDSLRLDYASGTTQTGPHKDEIRLTLDGNEIRFFGSQGEKRTGVLALRLAEVGLLRKQHKLPPVLLVDDVSSELDSVRRQALVDLLRQEDLQVFLTATELPSALVAATERPYEHLNLEKLEANDNDTDQ